MAQHCHFLAENFTELVIVFTLNEVRLELFAFRVEVSENASFVLEITLPVVKPWTWQHIRHESIGLGVY